MFDAPRYIQNSFSIFFPRQSKIRRMANEFEDKLSDNYAQPNIIPIPDDFSPEAPRIIFGSQNGYSQIVISQISITLTANYSPDWQLNIAQGKNYFSTRVPALFDLIEVLDGKRVSYCGFVSKVRLASQDGDLAVLNHLGSLQLASSAEPSLYELYIKKSFVRSERFFSNQNIRNYRIWSIPENIETLLRLPDNQITERGVEILVDYNDRYAYNQDREYTSDRGAATQIIDLGIQETKSLIDIVEGRP